MTTTSVTTVEQSDEVVEATTKKAPCKGSGKPPKKGSRGQRKVKNPWYGSNTYYTNPLQYECAECGRRIAKDHKGNLNRHLPQTELDRTKAKREAEKQAKKERQELIAQFQAKGMVEGFCAGCDTMQFMEDGDFLCPDCRNA